MHHPAALGLWLLALLLLGHAQRARADESLLYDERGNLQRRSLDGRTSTYRYDLLDRLQQESGAGNQRFSLDPNGNRSADGSATYSVQPNGNRLLTRNGFSYLYDPAGNLLSDQARLNAAAVTRSFTYTLAGQLKTVSINGSLVATYAYNSQHQRTRKTLATPPAGSPATTLYRYDPAGHLVEEIAAASASASGISVTAGQSLITYIWQDDIPTAVIWPPNSPGNPANATERIVYLHADTLGTPRKATDATGRTVWRWDSDAFGANPPEPDPDADGKPTVIHLRLPGQYFDAESGLHYNWHRFYDPQTGRFTQPDPIGLEGGINAYAYAQNNPANNIDPDGLQAIPLLPPVMPGIPTSGWSSPRPVDSTDPGSRQHTLVPQPSLPGWLKRIFPKSSLERCEADCDEKFDEDQRYCEAHWKMHGRNSDAYRMCIGSARKRYLQCYQDCKRECEK